MAGWERAPTACTIDDCDASAIHRLWIWRSSRKRYKLDVCQRHCDVAVELFDGDEILLSVAL